MEPNNQPQTPINENLDANPNTNTEQPTPHKKAGPVVLILAIVLILIIGALYLFARSIDTTTPGIYTEMGYENEYMMTDESGEYALPELIEPITSQSDDLSDLQRDLDMSVDGLDELNF